jgi:chorismate mutase
MAFKLVTKPAAASPAAAHWGDLARGPQGTSRVAFGPAPRNKGLRTANNSATPMAKYERSFSWLEIVWFNKRLWPLIVGSV